MEAQAEYNLRQYMTRIRSHFGGMVKVTVIVRMPNDPEMDVLMTTDSLAEVAEVVKRKLIREGNK